MPTNFVHKQWHELRCSISFGGRDFVTEAAARDMAERAVHDNVIPLLKPHAIRLNLWSMGDFIVSYNLHIREGKWWADYVYRMQKNSTIA